MNMPEAHMESWIIAEMNTHHFMFRGAGRDHATARAALLRAWHAHRSDLLRQYPERSGNIPDAENIEQHFRIYYLEFAPDAGYRDGHRLT